MADQCLSMVCRKQKAMTPMMALEAECGKNEGVPHEEILQSYPALTRPDIDAALAYAAELTREGTVDLPLEIKA